MILQYHTLATCVYLQHAPLNVQGVAGCLTSRAPPQGRRQRAVDCLPSPGTCRGTWARVTIAHFRHLAFQNCMGHRASADTSTAGAPPAAAPAASGLPPPAARASSARTVRASRGRLSARSVFHRTSVFYGAFVWARRARNRQNTAFPGPGQARRPSARPAASGRPTTPAVAPGCRAPRRRCAATAQWRRRSGCSRRPSSAQAPSVAAAR